MAMTDTLRRWVGLPERTVFRPFNIDMLAQMLSSYDMLGYPTIRQTLNGEVEEIGTNFSGLTMGAFKRNGIIFTCMATRQLLFSQARFQFQELRQGAPGDLFGNADLALLENPWPNATTGDLLSRAIQDVDLAGNFFAARRPGRIRRLRPDWVTIILGSDNDVDTVSTDIDAEVIGYAYYPGGYDSGVDPTVLLPDEVAHWAPIPDPDAGYRGISWIEAIRREVTGDSAARDHKLKFFENGATPNMVVSLDLDDPEKFKRLVETMDTEYKGLANAYKTLYLAAGATATPVGANMQQIDFKAVQSAGEVRIAAASGIHPVILGLSDSLSGSSLNAGNFTAARRLTADKTMRPLWQGFAGAMQTIIRTPGGSRLWYDDRHIPFLADDVKDAAEVRQMNASAIRQLIDGGFDPDAVIEAVVSGDLKRLRGGHSGLVSVQLLPPGTTAKPSSNGTEPIPEPAVN
jgi:phage portal protein BeeE